MNLIIGVVVIGIIIAGIAFFMASKSDSKNTTKEELQSTAKRESQSRIQGESQGTTQKESQRELQSAAKKELQNISTKEEASADMQAVKQKEQLYHYMTQELQNLVCVYNKEEWSQLKKLGEISQELYKEKNDIIAGLSTITGRMVKEYFTCVDFREEEGKLVGYVNDIEKLKQVFLQFMMPFYPYYYKELSEGGLRYTALLHPNTLRLFQQLTGKFPTWLCPEQVRVLPISEKFADYAEEVNKELKKNGILSTVDNRSEKIGYKIREARLQKLPYMLVVGAQEQETGKVSVRSRFAGDEGQKDLKDFISAICEEIRTKEIRQEVEQ